jgi:hypothetical protein
MNSHHDHHGHDHHDHHSHNDDEKSGRTLSFEEKLVRIFEHWVKHNESHAQTYADWREKARSHGLDGIAGRLDEIARLSDQFTEKLKAGLNDAKKNIVTPDS